MDQSLALDRSDLLDLERPEADGAGAKPSDVVEPAPDVDRDPLVPPATVGLEARIQGG
jgi:hypothetical protein